MSDVASIRVLIVGMGFISRHMYKFLEPRPWFECVGVVDVSSSGLGSGKELTGLPDSALFTDLQAALEAVEPAAVLVNTPAELHYDQAKTCLESGCHVLVAKPMATDFSEALDLVEIARANGVTICVAQQIRYNRHFTAVTEYVKSGALGSVEAAWFMNSKPRPDVANLGRMSQPTLLENACHHFDAFLAVFTDHEPEWIVCDGFQPSWSKYSGPCMVNALVGFSDNLHLSYHGGFSSRAPMYEFRLEGVKGSLKCRGLHMSNDTMNYETASALGQFQPAQIDEAVALRDPFIPFVDEWHGYLAGAPEPPFSGRNNLRTVAMLAASIESVETGSRVEIAQNRRFEAAFTG